MVSGERVNWRAGELESWRRGELRDLGPRGDQSPGIGDDLSANFREWGVFSRFFNWARWLTYFCPRITQINADFFGPLSINPFLFEKLA